MSGARVAVYVMSAAEIAAREREQRRLGLCVTADTMIARQGRLAERATRLAAAFDVAELPVPPLGAADRSSVEALERFVADAAELLGQAERQLTERRAQLTRQLVAERLRQVADSAQPGPGSEPAADHTAPGRAAEGPSAAPLDRTRARDLAAATDLMASLEEQESEDSFLEQIVQEIQSAPAGRRHLLLTALTAEVRDRNERAREDAEVRETLATLRARAGQLNSPDMTELVAAAGAAHASGQPVDLVRLETTVGRAESIQEQHERLNRAMDLVAVGFAARGYTVLPGADVFTAQFGLVLRSDSRSSYGIGIDVKAGAISFTTTRLVDTAGTGRTGSEQADRESTCRDIDEVSRDIPGLRIEELEIVGDDVELRVPDGVIKRQGTPVAAPRADYLPER